MAQQSFLENNLKSNLERSAPLAQRMRPRNLDEFVGQEHIVGEGKILRRLIAADRLSSVIFYGPPGTGKTSLAKIIATTTKSNFYELNAVTSGKKDIQSVLDKARDSLSLNGRRTILFIDEIHRFNKAQQDLLLPSVEEGLIILIGATTENPLFEINSPLISRSTLFEFEALSKDELKKLLNHAIMSDRGLGGDIVLTEEARDHLIASSGGDIRRALNAVELAYLTQPRDKNGKIKVTVDVASECIQKKAVRYDKSGDSHYDTISAFIKSVRGSDPDGALFWLAKMLEAGEDPKFIARRLVILASEDIGNAEPQALPLAVAAAEAVNMIGMPEARINLAQATTFLASAPKSNASYAALANAQDALKHYSNGAVPGNLMNLTVPGSKKEREGREYVYPHDYAYNYYRQQYLPDDIDGAKFYFPTENGYEKEIKERLSFLETIGDKSE